MAFDKMRVLIFIDQLNRGGSGRVCCILANLLADKGYCVYLASDYVTHPLSYELNEKVIRLQLNYCHNHTGLKRTLMPISRLFEIRRLYQANPSDVVIAFLPRMFRDVKVGLLGINVPVIASDHTSMSRSIDRITDYIRHHFYSVADAVTILTKKDEQYLGNRLANKVVVYNPLTYMPNNQVCPKRKVVLCAGTVSFWHIKGFDRMLKMWKNIYREFPEWTLEIAGPGNEESFTVLKNLCAEYCIAESVRFLGQVADMQTLYLNSSVFALPSRVEGFPMVLIEAMSQGCACVAFELQGAVREIICNGVDGLIASDNNCGQFEDNLRKLMESEEKRIVMADNAVKNVFRFSQQSFVAKWEGIIRKVIQ